MFISICRLLLFWRCSLLLASFSTGAFISVVAHPFNIEQAAPKFFQFHHKRKSQNKNGILPKKQYHPHWSSWPPSFRVLQVHQTAPPFWGGTASNRIQERTAGRLSGTRCCCFWCVTPARTSSTNGSTRRPGKNCSNICRRSSTPASQPTLLATTTTFHKQGSFNSSPARITTTMMNHLRNGGGSDDLDVVDDAWGYHHIVSQSVDITNGYVRNGILTVDRSVRDIEGNKRRIFVYTIPTTSIITTNTTDDTTAAPASSLLPPPYERSPKIKHVVPSPSGNKIAIFMEEEEADKQKTTTLLEIWTNHGTCLQTRIVLPTNSKRHEQMLYNDSRFGGVSWHPKETALVYVAERKFPVETKSFFDTTTTEKDVKKGGQYTLDVGLKEDFGEKFGGVSLPGLFVVSIETGMVDSVDNVPPETALGQPVFDPLDGTTIVYTAWEVTKNERRLGSVYCYQRPSKLYVSSVQTLLCRLNNKTNNTTDTNTLVKLEPNQKEEAPFCICLTPQDSIVRSPRFSLPFNKDGAAKLAFLYNTNGFDTHDGVVGLATMDWSLLPFSAAVKADSTSIPDDYIQSTIMSTRQNLIEPILHDIAVTKDHNGISFPGLFLDQLSKDCFTSDGSMIVVETKWACQNRLLDISTKDGTMTPLLKSQSNQSASQSMLCLQRLRRQNNNDHADDILFYTESTPTTPTTIHRVSLKGILEEGGNQKIMSESRLFYTFQPISISRLPPFSSSSIGGGSSSSRTSVCSSSFDNQMDYDIVTIPANDSIIQGILLQPKKKDKDESNNDKKLPLIVVPHGGPHSCFVTQCLPTYTYLCVCGGYAVLLVNYRGSTGYGQCALESLVGNAGTQDVVDVVQLTHYILDNYKGTIDPNRVGICGGSHGGYLAGHCIGQHPDLFKVAVMRNPVTNIASMVSSTDIPDWCYVESIGTYDFSKFRPPTAEHLVRMHEASPIAHIHNVVAPTLIALGLDDKRVPPISQGMEYFYALRSKNGSEKTKLLLYDKNDHAIDQPREEADHWINIKQWFDQHL